MANVVCLVLWTQRGQCCRLCLVVWWVGWLFGWLVGQLIARKLIGFKEVKCTLRTVLGGKLLMAGVGNGVDVGKGQEMKIGCWEIACEGGWRRW